MGHIAQLSKTLLSWLFFFSSFSSGELMLRNVLIFEEGRGIFNQFIWFYTYR